MLKDIIPIANAYGWTSDIPNLITVRFLDFTVAMSSPAIVVDIGVGLGVATLPALRAGAFVIVNDISLEHLSHVGALAAAEGFSGRFRLLQAALPDLPEVEPLDAVHCSNVLHFLSGAQLFQAVRWMYHNTKPGGHVFVQTMSPFSGHYQKYLPAYEERKQANDEWPGEISDAKNFVLPSLRDMTPNFVHVMDRDVISQLFKSIGFIVNFCEYYSRRGLPELCRLDGRENLGLIAVRPK
jgi:2-polyprenyl-3-methyl-5-hydroxy-6-metoxy-1,4-benzoquinol methylase